MHKIWDIPEYQEEGGRGPKRKSMRGRRKIDLWSDRWWIRDKGKKRPFLAFYTPLAHRLEKKEQEKRLRPLKTGFRFSPHLIRRPKLPAVAGPTFMATTKSQRKSRSVRHNWTMLPDRPFSTEEVLKQFRLKNLHLILFYACCPPNICLKPARYLFSFFFKKVGRVIVLTLTTARLIESGS